MGLHATTHETMDMMDGELEKGLGERSRLLGDGTSKTLRLSGRWETVVRWRHVRSAKSCKVLVALTMFVLFLWQYGSSIHAQPLLYTRHSSVIEDYVLEYAPLVWLDEQEQYFPSDIYAQIENTYPAIDLTELQDLPSPLTLDNLHELNKFGIYNGSNVYLTSNLDVTKDPKWLDGVVPNSAGKTKNAISAAIIINDHGSGLVDAYYMYFYAYNMGNTVLFQELGDHIGDWEHNMIRFQDGKPVSMWYSQHGNGEAFNFAAVEKIRNRPVAYSARGSHANYATKGTHDHTIPDLNLPIGPLEDFCSQGMLWDPTLSSYYYTYNASSNTFGDADGKSPVGAMYFRGHWGDEQYPMSDKRQKDFFGFKKFVSGPTGPWDKGLNRTKVCPDNGIYCVVRDRLGP